MEFSLSYPDEIQAGQPVELSTSMVLGSGAGFTVTAPDFKAQTTATLSNYNFQINTSLPASIPSELSSFGVSGLNVDYSGNQISESLSIESSSVSADNPLRMEAEINLPDWVNQNLPYPSVWGGVKLDNEKEGCLDDMVFYTLAQQALGDVYYKFQYTLLDSGYKASAELLQNLSLEVIPTGTLTLEDGSQHFFNLNDGLTFTPETSADTDGDGIVTATLEININPVFSNDTTVNSTLSHPFKAGYVAARIQDALCISDSSGALDDVTYNNNANPPFTTVNQSEGLLIDVEPSLSYSKTFDPISFALNGSTYTQQLAFDFCNDSSSANCAATPPPNTPPSASSASVEGNIVIGETLSGSYSYSDTDGDAESGSTFQWNHADDTAGSNSTVVSSASNYTLTVDDLYVQFCVTPSDGSDSGTQACSSWATVPVPNSPPTVSNVSIAGYAMASVTLRGNYDYSDTNGDAESGSSYQWYRADDAAGSNNTALNGATANSYTVLSTDEANYLQFCVTPSDGEDSGNEVCSTAILVNTALNTPPVAGFAKALNFDGSSTYGRLSSVTPFNPTDGSFTLESWFKVNDLYGVQHLLNHIDHNGSGNTLLGISSGNQPYTWLGGLMAGNTVLTTGTWYHIAVVYDQDSSTLSLYLNGVLEASEVRSLTSNSGDLVLGVTKTLNEKFFAGALDETRLWSEARTQAQIQQHMGLSVLPSNEPDLRMQLSYDNDIGNTLIDMAGHFSGSLYNAMLINSMDNHALSFDGSNDYVQIPQVLNPGTQNAFTAETWFKVESFSSDYQMLIAQNDDGLPWLYVPTTNKLRSFLGNDTLDGVTELSAGTWYHAAVTYDGTTLSMYLNGELEASAARSMDSATGDLLLGVNNQMSMFLNGAMDEVRIWDTARSPSEIQITMYQALAGTESGLLAYYDFEEGTGDTAIDRTDNGYNGNLTNTLAISEHPSERTLSFDGTDDYVQTPYLFNPDTQDTFTVETWFKVNSFSSSYQMLVAQNGNGLPWLYVPGTNKLRSFLGSRNLNGVTTLSEGVWYHAAITYNGTTLSLYLNGELESSGTRSMKSSMGDLLLGTNKNLSMYLDGEMDEVRIWSTALSQSEIQANLYQMLTGTETGLLAYYSFEDSNNTSITDFTSNAYTGTAYNGPSIGNRNANTVTGDNPTHVAATKHHHSTDHTLSFDGVNDYVDMPALGTEMSEATIEFWLQSPDFSGWNTVWDFDSWSSKAVHLQFNTDDYLGFSISGNSPTDQALTTYTFSTDTWYHVAVAYSSVDKNVKFYVNGELIDTKTYTTALPIGSAASNIGSWNSSRLFQGDIDEFRIWNTALSQSDIQANMNLRLSGSESNLVAYYNFEDGTATDGTANANNGTLQGGVSVSYRGIGTSTTGSGDLTGVLPATAATTFSVVTNPTLGNANIDSSGSFTYSPTDSSAAGTDSFSYSVSDGTNTSDAETVTVTLEGLIIGGGTGGSSVSAGDLINQLQKNMTQTESDCTPQPYYVVDEERLNRYNEMPYLEGLELIQNPLNGTLEVELGDTRYGLQPYGLAPGGNNDLHISEQNINVGAEDEVLMTRPALLDPCTLERLIGPFEALDNGLLQVSAGEGSYYIARPAWTAKHVEAAENELILGALNSSLPLVILNFSDDKGTWQQALFPALADREAVENFLGEFLEDAENGELAAQLANGSYRFIPDYLVTQGNPTGFFSVEALGDANEDGQPDFALIYPDGKRQEVYGVK